VVHRGAVSSAIQEELHDLTVVIAEHERALTTHPTDTVLHANLHTLRKRQRALKDAYRQIAETWKKLGWTSNA
jgi:hypothetical protein